MSDVEGRRRFLTGAIASAGAALVSCHASIPNRVSATSGLATGEKPVCDQVNEVLPVEDLMREHGVLRRVLLVYEEYARRVNANEPADDKQLVRAVKIMKTFVHDYHEKNEEDYVFPRFERDGKHIALVRTLREQHDAGRRLSERILTRATEPQSNAADAHKALAADLMLAARMYQPHAAREDTVLFPALHELVTPKEYDELSDTMEDLEHKLFGERGFERIVGEMGDIEHAFGIEDLSLFTAR